MTDKVLTDPMYVTVCPTHADKDREGQYTMNEMLFFRKFEDAQSWLQKQPFSDGQELYTVSCINKGLYVRHNKTLIYWVPDFLEQAEDYAELHGLKIIEFQRSWLE